MALQNTNANKISGTFSLPSGHLLHASPSPAKKQPHHSPALFTDFPFAQFVQQLP